MFCCKKFSLWVERKQRSIFRFKSWRKNSLQTWTMNLKAEKPPRKGKSNLIISCTENHIRPLCGSGLIYGHARTQKMRREKTRERSRFALQLRKTYFLTTVIMLDWMFHSLRAKIRMQCKRNSKFWKKISEWKMKCHHNFISFTCCKIRKESQSIQKLICNVM